MNARRSKKTRFAHLKDPPRVRAYSRLRGRTGARDEFHLGAIVQNLKTPCTTTDMATDPRQANRERRVRVGILRGKTVP